MVVPSPGVPMIGPLPRLHRYLFVLAAVLVGAGLGGWAGLVPEVPVGVGGGVLAGVSLGLGAAFLVVHDSHRRSVHSERARGPRP